MSEAVLPCLYRVTIGHARAEPVEHSFRYSSYMWLWELDLPPQLPAVLKPLARFDKCDHLDVKDVLLQHGVNAERIVVLSQARVLGYAFNPLSVYWCYGAGGQLVAHVAEVHNTYGGRHAYVLTGRDRSGPNMTRVDKAMYVSPFNPVEGTYLLSFGEPGPTVSVRVNLERPGKPPFRAWLTGRRQRSVLLALLRNTARYPLGPLRIRALIQWQGFLLWKRGLEIHPR